jgi:hypothetical protein
MKCLGAPKNISHAKLKQCYCQHFLFYLGQMCCHIADGDFLKHAKNLGALKTFQKPFKQADILAAVDELFD